MSMAFSVDFSKLNQARGLSQTLFEPQGQYAFWGSNIGLTNIDGNQCAVFLGASGFMQMDGYFSACEMETLGNATFSATLSVNGLAAWSQNAGQTGVVKKTVFTDAGPGWNSFNIGVGGSMGAIGIQKINLYQRARNNGISYGFLGSFDIAQTYTNRDAINASLMALGGVKRTYADQLYFKNTWNRGQTWSVPGGVYYTGASTNGSLTFQYYGTNFGVVGTLNPGSTLTLDGIGYTLSQNVMNSVATLGFHTISYTGGTATISAIDYLNPVVPRSRVDAIITALPGPAPQPITTDWQKYNMTFSGSGTTPVAGTIVRNNAYWRRVGDSMEINYSFQQSGAGTSGSGDMIFNLPAPYVIDTNKIALDTVGNVVIGDGTTGNGGNAVTATSLQAVVIPYGATGVAVMQNGSPYVVLGNSNTFLGGNANAFVCFKCVVPIVGWSNA